MTSARRVKRLPIEARSTALIFSPLLPISYPRRPSSGLTSPIRPSNLLLFLWETGAGEGIRTLDPNLGKVVLYP